MSESGIQHRPKIIDAWAQPALAQLRGKMPEIEHLFAKSGTAGMLEEGASPEALVSLMDRAGIDRLLLSAWHRPGEWVITNDEVAAIVRDFPDRFAGVAAVDLQRPLAAIRELERAVVELGMIGLRVLPWLWKLPPNDKLYYPLYIKCIELGIPFCTQVGHTGPMMPSEPGRPIPYLDEVALTFPELVIVGGHIGYPWTDEMISLAWKYPNVYIDTSAWLPRYYPAQLIHFMKTNGRDKVLFGTNFPMLDLQKCAAGARSLDLGELALANFLAGNAERVFRLTQT